MQKQFRPWFFVGCLFLVFVSCQDPMPKILIKTNGDIRSEQHQACDIYYQNDSTKVHYKANVKARERNSSQHNKHSFSLELDEKFDFTQLPKGEHWILEASYFDKTFLRHKISNDLFRSMGLYNEAAQSDYVQLKHNDQDMGLYLLMEEINAEKLNLSKKDSLAVLFMDPPIFQADQLKSNQSANNYYHQKYPKISIRDQSHMMEKLKSFLFDSSDDAFLANIESHFDLNNIMDWHLLLLLSNHSDGLLKNFYLYRKNSTTPFRIAVWNYEHSFGRNGDEEHHKVDDPIRWKQSILLKRLMESPNSDYPENLKQRWRDLRKTGVISKGSLMKMMEINQKEMAPFLGQNEELWPLNSKWYVHDNNYEDEIEIMTQFIHLRIPHLDEYFQAL